MKIRSHPRSIKLFALAYLGQGAAALAHNLYNADFHRAMLRQLISPETGAEFLPALLAIRLGVVVVLAGWLWARASNVAKWIIVLLFLPLLSQVTGLWAGIAARSPNAYFWLATAVLYLAAILLLFMPDARYWFATKGGTIKNNAAVFD